MNLKKKFLRKENGITLIALVITIIVLLILAGVAISMLTGENGVLNKATNAEKNTGESEEKELVKLAVTSAVTIGNGEIVSEEALEVLRNELRNAGCANADEIIKLPEIAEMKYKNYEIDQYGNVSVPPTLEELLKSGDAVGKKTKIKDKNNDTIVIPAQFKIATDSSTLVKEGIVVIAPDNSEFVWVPVKDINSMVMCQGSTGANDCNITIIEDKLVCSTHTGKNLCGKLYATTGGNNFNSSLSTQTYNVDTTFREPAVLTDTTSGDYVTGDSTKGIELIKKLIGLTGTDDEIKTQWQTQLQVEYDEMAKSVYENKGFYVGRYETSLRFLGDGTKVAQSKSNQKSATTNSSSANTWYGLYQREKEYSIKNGLTDIVGSTMIWGSQYDQMMLWIQANGYNVKSTNSTELKGATKNTSTTTTGVTGDKDILNKIYDLLGCKFEYTLEANVTGTGYRVDRGRDYGNSAPPSVRSNFMPYYNTYSDYSSRVSLYIQ